MNFPLFFLILLPFISAYPTADNTDITGNLNGSEIFEVINAEDCREDAKRFSRCMKEFVPKEDHLKIANRENHTKEETREFFSATKKAMACVGEVTCNSMKLSKFMIEIGIFVEENRNLVEECLEKSSIEKLREYCTSTIAPAISKLSADIHTSRCIASRLECTDNDKITFLKSEFAGITVEQITKQMKEQGLVEVLKNFDRTFNPEDYSDIEL